MGVALATVLSGYTIGPMYPPADTELWLSPGGMDIYLLDQVLRGRVRPGMRILDAGCGAGRNLIHFLRSGYEVFGVDSAPGAIEGVRRLAAELAPRMAPSNFRAERIEESSFPDESADVVISCAVLHFARGDHEFEAALRGCWRVLARGGVFFCRLASTIGMPDRFQQIDGRRYLQPDGGERYLVDEELLMARSVELGGELLDPLKTTVVQDRRCMTTWVLGKPG